MPRYYLPKINKYATFAASIPVALSGGLAYCFGIWSPSLKAAYHLKQSELELIGAWHNFGGYSSIVSGLVYDALEHRHHVGPRLSLALGAITNSLGFLGLWAAVTRRFVASEWQLAVFAVLAGNGGTWLDTATLSTNLRNFPASRGTVVGIVKAAVGLSASLYTAAYTGFLQPRADLFLIFLALVPVGVILLSLPLINFVPYVQDSERLGGYKVFSPEGRFLLTLQTIGALALYLMATALTDALSQISGEARGAMAIGAVCLLLPLIFVPAGSGGLFSRKASNVGTGTESTTGVTAGDTAGQTNTEAQVLREALLGREDDNQHEVDSQECEDIALPGTESATLKECLVMINFWLLALVCGIGIGSGLAFLNNVAQLVTALEGPPEARSVLVSLFGVTSCGGRLLFGAAPEKALHSYGVPRTVFLIFTSAVTAGTFAGLAASGMSLIYPLAGCAGLAFGAYWSLLPSLASEFFGLDNFASIYTMLQLAPAGGGYGMGAVLVGHLYQAAIRRHDDPDAGTTCIGHDCFQTAFLIISGMAGLATCISGWLFVRTLSIYRKEVLALRSFDSISEDQANRA